MQLNAVCVNVCSVWQHVEHAVVEVCTGQSMRKYAESKVCRSMHRVKYMELCGSCSCGSMQMAKYVEVCRGQSMWAAVPVAVRGKVGQLCNAAAEEEESLDRIGPLQRSS